jgi:hypothetical protein
MRDDSKPGAFQLFQDDGCLGDCLLLTNNIKYALQYKNNLEKYIKEIYPITIELVHPTQNLVDHGPWILRYFQKRKWIVEKPGEEAK